MIFKENCDIGDVVLVRRGKDNKPIAYAGYGKVIIPVNTVKYGYAKITSVVKIADRYILAEMENVIRDYYDNIPYEEFKKVLEANDYKIGFDRPFETIYEYGTEHQILAYNISNGIVIVAETFYGSKTFNSIQVYCPNVDGLKGRNRLMFSGSSTMSVLDLCRGRNIEFPLEKTGELIENKDWNSRDHINLWTYADADKNQGISLWEDTIDRILLADKEIESILGNCKTLIPIFKKREDTNTKPIV